MGFRSSILAGTSLIREAIKSPDYTPGVSGWSINRDGSAEFNDVDVRGALHAGDDQDYVEVSPTPHPQVVWSTSDPDQLAPATIGFESAGGHSWAFNGPDLGRGPDRIEFATSPALNLLTVEYQDSFSFGHSTQDVEIAGTSTLLNLSAVGSVNFFTPVIKTNNRDRGRGLLDYTSVQASTALAAGEAIGITSDTVDFEVGRAYEVTLHYRGSGNTANDAVGFRIRRTNLAGTSLYDSLDTHNLRAASAIVNGEVSQICVNTTGATLSTVLVGTVYRRAGAGTVQWFANASNLSWIRIKDVGAATDYPNAKAL
jgi:hypothetical protein